MMLKRLTHLRGYSTGISDTILCQFPQDQFVFCFAYGSAVKRQLGYDQISHNKPMIDTIFCIENAQKWHAENLAMNPSHYSFLRRFGSSFVSRVQHFGGAKVYFNTLIPWTGGGLLKYGVVTKADLIDDLNNWTYLYLAGRLQKPVEILQPTTNDPVIQRSIARNLECAVRAALLLLPDKFSFYELFHTVSALSYSGDFRMIFGENKNKVHNIVTSQLDDFKRLYLPIMRTLESSLSLPSANSQALISQNRSPEQQLQHLKLLPNAVRNRIMLRYHGKQYNDEQQHDVLRSLVDYEDVCQKVVRLCINQIVWNSSVLQSIKNIPTAGVEKSLRYSWKKALKTFAL